MILVIDTASPEIRLALGGTGAQAETHSPPWRGGAMGAGVGSTALPTMVEKFRADKKLDAVGVITGPGSFTGIRMGLAYAKGLAMGLKIPLVGMNVFELFSFVGEKASRRANTDSPPWRGGGEADGVGFAAIKSDRGDFYTFDGKEFGIAKTLPPDARLIENWDLAPAIDMVAEKLKSAPESVIPLYIRPSYVG